MSLNSLPFELKEMIFESLSSEDKLSFSQISRNFRTSYASRARDHLALQAEYVTRGHAKNHLCHWNSIFRLLRVRPGVETLITEITDDDGRRLPGSARLDFPTDEDRDLLSPEIHQINMSLLVWWHEQYRSHEIFLFKPLNDFLLPGEEDIPADLPRLADLSQCHPEQDQVFAQVASMLPRLRILNLDSANVPYASLAIVLIKTVRMLRLINFGDSGLQSSPARQATMHAPVSRLTKVEIKKRRPDQYIDFDILRWMMRLPTLRTLICARAVDNGTESGVSRIAMPSYIETLILTDSVVRNCTLEEEIRNIQGLRRFRLWTTNDVEDAHLYHIDMGALVSVLSERACTTLEYLEVRLADRQDCLLSFSAEKLSQFTALKRFGCHWEDLMISRRHAEDLLAVLPHSLVLLNLHCRRSTGLAHAEGFFESMKEKANGVSCPRSITISAEVPEIHDRLKDLSGKMVCILGPSLF